MDTGVNGVKLPNAQLLVVRGPGQGDATATIQAHKMAANIARTRLRVTPELSTACFLYVLVKRLIEQPMSYMGGPHSTLDSVLASHPAAPGLILGVPDGNLFQEIPWML